MELWKAETKAFGYLLEWTKEVNGLNLEMQQFKAEFFKALAHPLRIRILELLAEGDKNVNEIQTLVGSEGSAVSQQLTILRAKNIVTGTKEGNKVIYTLKDPMISGTASSCPANF